MFIIFKTFLVTTFCTILCLGSEYVYYTVVIHVDPDPASKLMWFTDCKVEWFDF